MICDGETYNNGANHVSPMLSLTYNLIPPKVVGGESGSALSVVSAKREPNNDASDSGASGPEWSRTWLGSGDGVLVLHETLADGPRT